MKINKSLIGITLVAVALSVGACSKNKSKSHNGAKKGSSPVLPDGSDPSQPHDSARPDSDPSQADRNLTVEREVRDALKYLLADSYEVAEGLETKVAALAETLSTDMKNCGFSYLGPKCLNYNTPAGSYEGLLFTSKGEDIFVTDLQFEGVDARLLFAFNIKEANGSPADELRVYLKSQDRQSSQSIKEYLDSASVQMISTIKISEDFLVKALEKVNSPESLQELYHMAQQLNELQDAAKDFLRSNLLVTILENKGLLSSEEVSEYKQQTYYLADSLGATGPQLIELALEMMATTDENLKQFAAVQVLLHDSSKDEYKVLVLKALTNNQGHVRKQAITALSKIDLTVDEQIKIIEMIGDSAREVRNEAVRVLTFMKLSSDHVVALEELLNNDDWAVRKEAAILLGRIKSQNSRAALSSRLDVETNKEVKTAIDRAMAAIQE